MTIKNRKEKLRILSHVYKRVKSFDLTKCYYCDETRECIDHSPALAVAIKMDIDTFKESGGELLLIPSCSKCNNMLGHSLLFTPLERLDHLRTKYLKLIEKLDKGWEEDEFEDLGYNLRILVESKFLLVNMYKNKVKNIESRMAEL